MAKKSRGRSNAGKRRTKQLTRASVALTAVITAGAVLAPGSADAALTASSDQSAYEAAIADGGSIALRDFLRLHPDSEMAKPVFVQLAAMCGGGGASDARDPDCTGSLAAASRSDPPERGGGDSSDGSSIY